MNESRQKSGLSRKQIDILSIALGAALLIAAMLVSKSFPMLNKWLKLVMFLVPYLICGIGVLYEAAEKLLHGELLDEDFLMSVASIGALCIGEYPEAVAVMLFYRIGEFFEKTSHDRSRRSITALMNLRPDFAWLETLEGTVCVSPEQVNVGEDILVRPGEKIPLDGFVIYGSSTLDVSALTGEAVPRSVQVGDGVNSGCVNISGVIRVRVTSRYEESTAAKILRLVSEAENTKSRREGLITRFAKVYTPIVVALAVLLAIIPSLATGEWVEWIRRALIFLVVSCPCALVLSIPLTFFSGIGGLSRRGVLVKGASYVEALADTSYVVFDKTGTVTQGSFSVSKAVPRGITEEHLLTLAAAAEYYSNHPIAAALRNACPHIIEPDRISNVSEIPGRGISATVYGNKVLVGNEALMNSAGLKPNAADPSTTVVHVAANGVYYGHIEIDDRIKEGAKDSVKALKKLNVSKIFMLTGDNTATGTTVGSALGVGANNILTMLMPADKVDAVKELLREKTDGSLVFAGDGVNDAPVIKQADVGVAMGVIGSAAAIEAADVVLMDDDIRKLPLTIAASKRTVRIAKQNIWLSLAVKFIILLLGALGAATMWLAVFGDVGVLILALLNAARASNVPENIEELL